MNEEDYRDFFSDVTSFAPHEYQVKVAKHICSGRNVLLRAPTGAGKTWAVLVPFLWQDWAPHPSRLIYALPLRTLAQGLYRESLEAARQLGKPIKAELDKTSKEKISPFVTIQTGEQPEDPFFDRGRIIITTYDQLLSGFLCSPYGLSSRLHNVNAAAIAGALLVFDEFHLMPSDKAFLTAVAALRTFTGLCQSVWMTATGTSPLEQILRSSLDTACVPENDAAMRGLMALLPSVNSVSRVLTWEQGPLTADAVISHHENRSIALTNTVGRSQELFEVLRDRLKCNPEVELILLHSRFFRQDRKDKESRLKALFGRNTNASAILVATQVIEAGIDISCEHLHTELCPMNSLVQRAGRCARFPGQQGTVHVYQFPDDRGWLPYGTLDAADPTVHTTRELLKRNEITSLDPIIAAKWVDAVHAHEDERLTATGVKERTNRVFESIYTNAIQRNPAGVAHLIRGDNSESIRLILSEQAHLPESPGKLESLSLSRWSLVRHLSPLAPFGWYWDGAELAPWKVLSTRDDLSQTYAIALPPGSASYDDEIGLRIGRRGDQESPQRGEPARPGYAPLREESWRNHSFMVANAAEVRLRGEGSSGSLVSSGFENLYGLNSEQLRITVRACGLLHDLGKLQTGWQRWAETWQQSINASYKLTVPLAHTDFNPDDRNDRERQRSIAVRRPSHAAASAYYSSALLQSALTGIPQSVIREVASACAAAIIAHHGGFIPKTPSMELGILPLWKEWEQLVKEIGCTADPEAAKYLSNERNKRGYLTLILNLTTSMDVLTKWWPLVSYLTRVLRLSDQRATSEWACND